MRRFLLASCLLILTLGITTSLVYSLSQTTASQIPTTSTSMNVATLNGHLGGPVQAVAMKDGTLLAAVGPEVATFDVSTPNQPERLDYQIYSENVNTIVISDDMAFVSDGNLHLLDISDPNNLVPIVGVSVPGTLLNLNVTGTQVVAVGSNFGQPFGQLRIFDVTTPTLPTALGELTFPVEARGVAFTGTTALVANDSNGLAVINMTNPESPQLVRTKATMGQAYDVLITGDVAYVATVNCAVSCTGGVQTFALSNPRNPSARAFVPLPSQPARLAIEDNFLMVANGAGGLALLDISDPLAPVNLGLTDLPEDGLDVATNGNDAYVATGKGGIQHVTISPTLHTGGLDSFSDAYTSVFSNGFAFIGDGTGLFVADTTDPANPELLAYTETSAAVYRLEQAGNHLFLSLQLDGLAIYDVANPLSPQLIAPFDTPGSVNGVVVDGNYAYLADGTTGLRVLDISTVSAPIEVANVDTAGVAWDLFKQGDTLYVADFDRGLRIFDVSDPTDPEEIGLYNTPGEVFGVYVFGDLAYLADGVEGVRIIDVSDPQAPLELSAFDNFRHAYDVELVGDHLYVANDTGGLLTLNVADPTAPFEHHRRNTAGQAWGISVDHARHLIAVGDRFGGFYLFKELSTSLAGSVVQANGVGFGGVTVSSDLSGAVVTDGTGRFTFPNPTLGQQTLSVELAGFVFLPPTQTVNLPPMQSTIRFTILPEPVQTTVSPAGGSLSYAATDGVTTTLTIPAGAVANTITLVLTPTLTTPPPGLAFAAHAFELAAYDDGTLLPGFTFDLPVDITVDYSNDDLSRINDENSLDLYLDFDPGWLPSGESCTPTIFSQLNSNLNRLDAALCQTGLFGLFGQPGQIYLPIIQHP